MKNAANTDLLVLKLPASLNSMQPYPETQVSDFMAQRKPHAGDDEPGDKLQRPKRIFSAADPLVRLGADMLPPMVLLEEAAAASGGGDSASGLAADTAAASQRSRKKRAPRQKKPRRQSSGGTAAGAEVARPDPVEVTDDGDEIYVVS